MMKNRYLSRHIADAGWGELIRMLEYKTKWYGSQLLRADKYYPSTKRCSECGEVKAEISLEEREYVCEECGAVIDRDENAARNLEELCTASSAGIYACGDTSDGGTQRNQGSTSHVSLKQEANTRFS
jgi:putative transposase